MRTVAEVSSPTRTVSNSSDTVHLVKKGFMLFAKGSIQADVEYTRIAEVQL
jgi:hypothetical protein